MAILFVESSISSVRWKCDLSDQAMPKSSRIKQTSLKFAYRGQRRIDHSVSHDLIGGNPSSK